MNLGDGNQTGDIRQRDAAGRDINTTLPDVPPALERLIADTRHSNDWLAKIILDGETETRKRAERDRDERELRQRMLDERLDVLAEEIATNRRWLIGTTLALVVLIGVVAALVLDRTILNPIIGAVLSLLVWRLGIRS